MGMYTGIYFSAKLKPLAAVAIKNALRESDMSEDIFDFWKAVSAIFPIQNDWMTVGRRDFIPFGALSYMPEEWDEIKAGEGLYEDETWNVCCSLKNYANEIEQFLDGVLPFLLKEICTVTYYYEEDESPRKINIYPADYIPDEDE
jgi:hypothetical protein